MTPLDPDFAHAAAPLEDYEADWVHGAPEDLRRAYDAARSALDDDIHPACAITPFSIAGPVKGLSFRPHARNTSPDTAIVYFHGGSWLVGSPSTHKVACSHLAVSTGLTVHSIEYRLVPEHPYPSQRDDGVRAVRAVLSGALDDPWPPAQLILAGDSAGAAICFWIDAVLPDAERTNVRGILAFYGAYGLTESASLEALGRVGSGLSRPELDAAYARLGGQQHLSKYPEFAIASTARPDGPPCYLAAAELDPIVDDSHAVHHRLSEAGRPVVLDVATGLPHSYLHYVGRVPAVRAALNRAARWISTL